MNIKAKETIGDLMLTQFCREFWGFSQAYRQQFKMHSICKRSLVGKMSAVNLCGSPEQKFDVLCHQYMGVHDIHKIQENVLCSLAWTAKSVQTDIETRAIANKDELFVMIENAMKSVTNFVKQIFVNNGRFVHKDKDEELSKRYVNFQGKVNTINKRFLRDLMAVNSIPFSKSLRNFPSN